MGRKKMEEEGRVRVGRNSGALSVAQEIGTWPLWEQSSPPMRPLAFLPLMALSTRTLGPRFPSIGIGPSHSFTSVVLVTQSPLRPQSRGSPF